MPAGRPKIDRQDLTVAELAALLGVSQAWLETCCRVRSGRFFFLGARMTAEGWVIPQRSVARALAIAEVGLLLSVADVQAITGFRPATIRRMVARGDLPQVVLPGMSDVRIPAASLSGLASQKERMHCGEGRSEAKGRGVDRVSGAVRRDAKWYSTADLTVDNQRVADGCGACCGGSNFEGEGGGDRRRGGRAQGSID